MEKFSIYLTEWDKNIILTYLKSDTRPVVKELAKIIENSKSILVRN